MTTTKRTLETGILAIQIPEEKYRKIGSVAGSSPPNEPGVVSIFLKRTGARPIVRVADNGMTIYLPELEARAAGAALTRTTMQLEHLRALDHLGLLRQADDTIEEHAQEYGDREDGEILYVPDPGDPLAKQLQRVGFSQGDVVLLITHEHVLLAAVRIDKVDSNRHEGTTLFQNLPPSLAEAFRLQSRHIRDGGAAAELEKAHAEIEAFGIAVWHKRLVLIKDLLIQDAAVAFTVLV